jgi:hypothetical protein
VPDTPAPLGAIGLETYSQLYELPIAEVIKRLDEKNAPLHAGDAFLAVLVLRGVLELADAAEKLDEASRRYQIAGIVLAVVAVAVAIVQVIASL